MEVAQALVIEEYEKYNQQRLKAEAEQETLADDEELKRMAEMVEAKKGKSEHNSGREKTHDSNSRN